MGKHVFAEERWENDIHIVLAAKGGIGKTFVASLFAQYADYCGKPMKVLDLDQSNQMLARVPSLHAEAVPLLSDKRFDSAKMDGLIKRMVSEPGPYILDVGASTFIDMWRYFIKYQMFALLKAQGRRVIIHSVVVGGPEMPDTLKSFLDVVSVVPDRQVIVWLNPVRGAIADGGKRFLEMSLYVANQEKVLGVIDLPEADEATLGDLHTMTLNLHTLSTVNECEELEFFSKHRVSIHRELLFSQIGDTWEVLVGDASAAA